MEALQEETFDYVVKQVKPAVKEGIHELLERFWILREEDEELFYLIKDNEVEIKRFFRDTFRYRLISTHDLIKLEKIPMSPQPWMGQKINNATPVFKKPWDYYIFFLLLAFLEGKTIDQQFSLQNICEYLQIQEDGKIVWKDGAGYQNRLSLVRVMKYAVKMNLMLVIDQDIEDFAGNDKHDVLLQRTPYSSYFTRIFREDVRNWENLDFFLQYLHDENYKMAERKHRFYRKLFTEPIVYHHELTDDEKDYLNMYYAGIENNIEKYTDYAFERYKHSSMLVKEEVQISEQVFPKDNMISKLMMLFGSYLYQRGFTYQPNEWQEIELTLAEMDTIIAELKKEYRNYWTKSLKQSKVEEIRRELIMEMKRWNFAEETIANNIIIKEGLFRMIGDYFEEE